MEIVKRQLYFLFTLLIVLSSCNGRMNTKNINITDLKIVEKSLYEPDVSFVELKITNKNKDTLYLATFSDINVVIDNKVDTTQDASLVIPVAIETEVKGIPSSIPPLILFTDSSANLLEYYKTYLKHNEKLDIKEIQNKMYWEIKPLSSIIVRVILRFSLYELEKVDLEKLTKNPVDMTLFIKTKIYKSNFDFPQSYNITFTESSNTFLDIFAFKNIAK